MKKQLLVLLCLFATLCSCTKVQYDIINGPTLSGSISEKEWSDIDITNGEWHSGSDCYVLSNSGRWESGKLGDGSGVKYNFSDDSTVSVTNQDKVSETVAWSFDAASSVLTIGKTKHKVIGVEKDKLYLDYKNNHERIIILSRL